jgi:hypothetical protein
MTVHSWMYQDPAKVVEHKENDAMMKDSRVRQWARGLAKIDAKADREAFLSLVPEQYRDAVKLLARSKI